MAGRRRVFPKSEASSLSAAGSEGEQVVEYFGQEAIRKPIGQ